MQFSHAQHRIPLPDGGIFALGQAPRVVGILNVTPDSFSDGGAYVDEAVMLARARQMVADGADLIDVGGESTRPGAEPVSVEEELHRVIPAIAALRAGGIVQPISVDTSKAVIADRAIAAGAAILNDVRGLRGDPDMAAVAAQRGVPIIIMHWDERRDTARDIIDEMKRYFSASMEIATRAGIATDRIILDPGFGFAKSLQENYQVLRELARLGDLGLPLLVGTSRKSMIGRVLDRPVGERLAGTLATTTIAYGKGAHLFRVHDVAANVDALRVARATLYGPQSE